MKNSSSVQNDFKGLNCKEDTNFNYLFIWWKCWKSSIISKIGECATKTYIDLPMKRSFILIVVSFIK